MKNCRVCKSTLPITDFLRDRTKKDGYGSICRTCNKLACAASYQRNKIARNAASRAWDAANRDKIYAAQKLWRANNLEKARKCEREYYLRNKEARARKTAEWNARNAERVKAVTKAWAAANLPKKAKSAMARKSAKLLRTPGWLKASDFLVIEQFYESAKELTALTGIVFEVDHILPLQGKLVSGLHAPNNLQLLPKTLNRRKRNSYIIS